MQKRRTLAGLVLTSLCGCTGLIDDWPVDPTTAGVDPKTVALPKVVVAEPLHRLNRAEYDNTVRDLLGTTLTPARAFPADTAVGGFDNVANALTIPPSLFALYSDAAKELADATLRISPRYTQTLESRAIGVALAQPGGAFETWGWSLSGRFTGILKLPQAETVTLSLIFGGGRTSAAPVPIASLWVDGAKLQTWTIGAAAATPQVVTAKLALAPGNHQLQVSFDNLINEPAANQGNQLILGNITAASDALAVPPNRSKVYVCNPATTPSPNLCYEQIVRTFAERAWRRPLTNTEKVKLEDLYRALSASEGAERCPPRRVGSRR